LKLLYEQVRKDVYFEVEKADGGDLDRSLVDNWWVKFKLIPFSDADLL
jgi:hypothetical protein